MDVLRPVREPLYDSYTIMKPEGYEIAHHFFDNLKEQLPPPQEFETEAIGISVFSDNAENARRFWHAGTIQFNCGALNIRAPLSTFNIKTTGEMTLKDAELIQKYSFELPRFRPLTDNRDKPYRITSKSISLVSLDMMLDLCGFVKPLGLNISVFIEGMKYKLEK